MSMSNPLLNIQGLPPFSQIKPEHIQPAVEKLIQDCHDTIEQVLKQPHFTWENFILPLTETNDRLNRAWSPVSHLNSVKIALNYVKPIKRACRYFLNTALGLGSIKGFIMLI